MNKTFLQQRPLATPTASSLQQSYSITYPELILGWCTLTTPLTWNIFVDLQTILAAFQTWCVCGGIVRTPVTKATRECKLPADYTTYPSPLPTFALTTQATCHITQGPIVFSRIPNPRCEHVCNPTCEVMPPSLSEEWREQATGDNSRHYHQPRHQKQIRRVKKTISGAE